MHEDIATDKKQKGVDQTFVLSDNDRLEFEQAIAETIEFLVVEIKKSQSVEELQKAAKADPHDKLLQADLDNFIQTVIYKLKKKTIKNLFI